MFGNLFGISLVFDLKYYAAIFSIFQLGILLYGMHSYCESVENMEYRIKYILHNFIYIIIEKSIV